jgi:vacuolar-type H+-ATPase subunit H
LLAGAGPTRQSAAKSPPREQVEIGTGGNLRLALSARWTRIVHVGSYGYSVSAIRAFRDLIRVAENMGAVSTDTMPALGRSDAFVARLEGSGSATKAREGAPANLTLDRSPADALAAAKTQLAAAEAGAVVRAERERIIAEAQATARDIVAEAERAAQDIVASAVKIKAEADRALDDAKSKAVCIQKRAQAALALAENIAEGRRLIDALGG